MSEVKGVIIGVFVVGLLMAGLLSFYQGLALGYGTNTGNYSTMSFQTIAKANSTAQQLAPIINSTIIDPTNLAGYMGLPFVAATQGIHFGLALLGLLALPVDLLSDFAMILAQLNIPIPSWFLMFVGLIAGLVIVFGVVKFIIGRDV